MVLSFQLYFLLYCWHHAQSCVSCLSTIFRKWSVLWHHTETALVQTPMEKNPEGTTASDAIHCRRSCSPRGTTKPPRSGRPWARDRWGGGRPLWLRHKDFAKTMRIAPKKSIWNHSDGLPGFSIKLLAAWVSLLDSVLVSSIWPVSSSLGQIAAMLSHLGVNFSSKSHTQPSCLPNWQYLWQPLPRCLWW